MLIVKELGDFGPDFRRDVLADSLSSVNPMNDRQLMRALTEYGNSYLEKAKGDALVDGSIIWFDIHFGEPAEVGMTWAWNPHSPMDPGSGMDFFWRIWSETTGGISSLPRVQEELQSYMMQHMTKAPA